MRVSKIVYITKLSTVECLLRLESHVIPWSGVLRSTFTPMDKGTVVARVRGDSFRLFAQGTKHVQNSFVPLFYGRVEATTEGARIVGRFRMHLFVRVFMGVWFGGLLAGAGLLLFLPASAWGSGQRPPLFALLGPLVIGLLGFGLVRFGWWCGRGQAESLRSFLTRELEAWRRN